MTLFSIDYIIAGLINNILVVKILWGRDDGLIKVQFFLARRNAWISGPTDQDPTHTFLIQWWFYLYCNGIKENNSSRNQNTKQQTHKGGP